MELYIQIKDGEPYEHPIFADNFRAAFPEVDTSNLPAQFASFIRVEQNVTPGFYQVPYSQYEWVGNTVQDVWHLREMTQKERDEKDAIITEQMIATITHYKTVTENLLSTETDQAKIEILQNFLGELNAWTMGDPETAILPAPPAMFVPSSPRS